MTGVPLPQLAPHHSSLNLFKYESTTNELPIVTVEFDTDSIAEDEVDLENDEIILPSKKEYEQIAKLEGVDSYEINLLDIYLSPNLSDVSADEFSELGLFTIKGITGNPIFDEKLNNIKIIDGRLISEDEIRNGANLPYTLQDNYIHLSLIYRLHYSLKQLQREYHDSLPLEQHQQALLNVYLLYLNS